MVEKRTNPDTSDYGLRPHFNTVLGVFKMVGGLWTYCTVFRHRKMRHDGRILDQD